MALSLWDYKTDSLNRFTELNQSWQQVTIFLGESLNLELFIQLIYPPKKQKKH